MKKSVRIVALATLAVMLMMAFVACATPNESREKAVEALEDKDYEVEEITNDVALAFYALGDIKDLKAVVEAKKAADEDKDEEAQNITIYYFDDKEDAERALTVLEGKYVDEIADEEVVVGQKGEMAWVGTKQAVKDASGSLLAIF